MKKAKHDGSSRTKEAIVPLAQNDNEIENHELVGEQVGGDGEEAEQQEVYGQVAVVVDEEEEKEEKIEEEDGFEVEFKPEDLEQPEVETYLCFLLLAAVFGALVFVDVEDGGSRADAWIACFGVATLLALVAAALLLVEPAKDADRDEEETEDEYGDEGTVNRSERGGRKSWFDVVANTLKENHNANRLFVILEAVFDIVLATKNLRQSAVGLAEYDIALTAIVAAGMALCFIVIDIALFYRFRSEIAFVRAQRTTEPLWETVRARAEEARDKAEWGRGDEDNTALRADRCLFRNMIYRTYDVAFIFALILSDLADILLLSRSAVAMQFETKDLLLFIFLLSNVLVSEVFTGMANLFESFATQVRLSEMEDDSPERKKAEKELASAAALRTSLRRKANAQTNVTGLVVIPLVIAITLYVGSIVAVEDVCAIVMPFLLLACANLVLASVEFSCVTSTAPDSFLVKASGCMLGYVRVVQLSLRVLAGTWGVVLGHTDMIAIRSGFGADADNDVQRLIFDLYVVYMFVPLCIRLLADVLRCRGLRSTLRKHGDLEGRALTDTDFLCIGRYAGNRRNGPSTAGADDESQEEQGRTTRLEATYPTRVSLSLLCYGLSTWKAQQNEDRLHVELQLNGIGTRGAKVLAAALATNSSIHTLNLGYNGIKDAGAEAIGRALAKNKSSALIVLNLDSNNIGPKGAEHLAEALKINSTLLGLTLSFNEIRDAGAQALGKALDKNETLVYLNLVYNGIKDAGAEAIGRALAKNKSSALIVLNLSENKILDEGAKALGDGLKENDSLTQLNLWNNNIGDAGAVRLGGGLKVNESLTALILGSNNISEVVKQELRQRDARIRV